MVAKRGPKLILSCSSRPRRRLSAIRLVPELCAPIARAVVRVWLSAAVAVGVVTRRGDGARRLQRRRGGGTHARGGLQVGGPCQRDEVIQSQL